MKRALLLLLALLHVAGTGQAGNRRTDVPDVQLAPSQPRVSLLPGADALLLQSPASTLYSWTFDDGFGNADPQGWTTLDRTYQPAYFHIENFTEFDPLVYIPITGTKSLWCGRPACDSPTDCPMESDGYGNEWQQYWLSAFFPVSGDVPIAFNLVYDCEASYDSLSLYYATADNIPHLLRAWSGTGTEAVNEIVPASAHTGLLAFMFKFTSDSVFSDEDGGINTGGAAIIDDITIGLPNAPVDQQTFDNVADGATYTPDYHWFASGPPQYFGDYSGLNDGDTVLQEDPGYTNSTNVWSFFNGSTDTYACGGHPEQLAVPLTRVIDGLEYAIHNEIQSPPMSIVGFPSGHAMVLSFDVYRDMPLANAVTFAYRVRSKVGGVWRPWKRSGVNYYDPAREWRAASFNIQNMVRPGATDIQVALDVRDLCPSLCGPLYPGTCHSQGPLFDNVRLIDGNTLVQSGSQVLVPVDETTGTSPVTLTITNVTVAGNTTLVTSTAADPPAPGTFSVADGVYYDLSTTATASWYEVCIHYNDASLPVPENQLRLLHWDTQLNPDAWVDVTTSLDTANNVICGYTTHLSPFIVGGGSLTAVGDGSPRFALHQNVPNPFNPSTTISFEVPAGGARVELRIYDAVGRLVRTLVDEQRAGGTQRVTWDGRNGMGQPVASGVYFYRMTSGSFTESRRMVLLK